MTSKEYQDQMEIINWTNPRTFDGLFNADYRRETYTEVGEITIKEIWDV